MSKKNKAKELSVVAKETLANDNLPEFTIGRDTYKGRDPMHQVVGGQIIKVQAGIPYVKVIHD